MTEKAILDFRGDFSQGFDVTLRIEGKKEGKLPPDKEIPQLYEHWRSCYTQTANKKNCLEGLKV